MRECALRLAVVALGVASAAHAASGSGGCGAPAPQSGLRTMTHAGVERAYELRLPAGYSPDRPTPLVLVFHGWGGDEKEILGDPAVVDEANRRGYVLVAPRGLGSGAPDHARNSWTFRGSATGVVTEGTSGLPICDATITPDYTFKSCRGKTARNTCSWTQCQDDDLAFTRALLERVEADLCIDTGRVFATGGSNGGMFTWELGANPATGKLFRAIAPIVGLPHRGDLRGPARSGGLPVLLITGRSDEVVPPGRWDDEGFTTTSNDHDRFFYTGATAVVRRWSEAAGCSIAPAERPVHSDVTGADCRSYCSAGPGQWPRVVDCRAPMGHEYQLGWSWKLVMDFFDAQARPAARP